MTSYANNLRIAEIGTGEQAGVWGLTTNYNLATLLGEAIAGYTEVTVATSGTTAPTNSQALTAFNGTTDQSRQAIILLSGSPPEDFFLYIPPATKTYFFRNFTGKKATIRAATALNGITWSNGEQVVIPAATSPDWYSAIVTCDGTNVYTGANSVNSNFNVSGDLTVDGNGSFGGTGALVVPSGSTEQRPSPTDAGAIRYNSTLLTYEGYNGTTWGAIGGGGGGGGSNSVAFENVKLITVSYAVTSGNNAMSAGPISLAIPFDGQATLSDGAAGVGNILTVTRVDSGALYLGTVVTGPGFPANTTIIALGSGSGGLGTYTVSTSGGIFAAVDIASTISVTVPTGSNWVVVNGEPPAP
jgi:hypothetical protein